MKILLEWVCVHSRVPGPPSLGSGRCVASAGLGGFGFYDYHTIYGKAKYRQPIKPNVNPVVIVFK